jgi:hypothetical protein
MQQRAFLSLGLCSLLMASACGGSSVASEGSGTGTGGTGGTTSPDAGTTDAAPDSAPDSATPDSAVPDSAVPGSLEGTAFDIEIPLPGGGYGWCQGDCTPATVLVTRVDDSSMELVWGATGRATKVLLSRSAEGWEMDDTLQLGTVWSWEYAMCPNETNLGPAMFDFADHDEDGVLDLVITGHQESRICSDDYTSGESSEVTLLGHPHTAVPVANGPSDGFEPMHGVAIEMTEPLEGVATCELLPEGGGASIALQPVLEADYVVGFSSPIVLPVGASHTAKISGKSFTGTVEPAAISVRTLEDFGVLAQDGFESASMEGISGATIVDASTLPVIDGQRMLLVEPGKQVLLRLRRTGNEQSLVMDGRATNGCGWGLGGDGISVEAAVVGTEVVESAWISMGEQIETVPLNNGEIEVGELQTLSLSLPDAGEDVLVYMQGTDYQGAGCVMWGALIDNVRLE